MIDKRFSYIQLSKTRRAIIDNETQQELSKFMTYELLNSLHEENRMLKQECQHQQGQKQRLVNYLRKLGLTMDKIQEISNDKEWLDGDV